MQKVQRGERLSTCKRQRGAIQGQQTGGEGFSLVVADCGCHFGDWLR